MQQQRELTRNHCDNGKRAKGLGLVFAVAAFFAYFFGHTKK
jgi:hypothetical protein